MHRGGVFSHLWPLNRCRGQPTDSELLYLCHHFAGLGLEIALRHCASMEPHYRLASAILPIATAFRQPLGSVVYGFLL